MSDYMNMYLKIYCSNEFINNVFLKIDYITNDTIDFLLNCFVINLILQNIN